jgi:hypothetical protein
MSLTPEQIAELLGKSRKKGIYVTRLNEFIASGEGGWSVREQWPDWADATTKKAASLKQGFDSARDKKETNLENPEQIRVIANENDVYLINLLAAGAAFAEAPAEAEAEAEAEAVSAEAVV